MASFYCDGIEEFISLCTLTEKQADRIFGKSIHSGARVMADAIKRETQNLMVDDRSGIGGRRTGPTQRQKNGLIKSLGIAGIRKNPNSYLTNVKIGWDGYNDIVTDKYPKGQPNAMIARSVNVGTSFMSPQAFVDRAVTSARSATLAAMSDECDRQIERIWK